MVSDFALSWLVSEDELELAPVPAEPLGLLLEEELGLDDEAPPLDGLLSEDDDDEELDGAAGAAPEVLAEPLIEPDGVDGVVAPEDDEDDGDDGEVDDGLDEAPVAARSLPARSQAVSRLAPSAMETAIAIVESLMWPPWLGYLGVEQGMGRAAHTRPPICYA